VTSVRTSWLDHKTFRIMCRNSNRLQAPAARSPRCHQPLQRLPYLTKRNKLSVAGNRGHYTPLPTSFCEKYSAWVYSFSSRQRFVYLLARSDSCSILLFYSKGLGRCKMFRSVFRWQEWWNIFISSNSSFQKFTDSEMTSLDARLL